ncbi:MAG: LytR C-terminal domain-containing protein [Candidatus Daviesbacteria bacterium]|nr:LytR C-terminal domain-containing protein [Candidatus Daviesbacteria bacterium]
MEEENISNLSAPAPAEQKYNFSYNIPKKKSNKTIIVLIIILLMIFLAIGVFFFRSSVPAPVSAPTPSPTAYETPSPSPSPLVRADWSFEVLNGSGTSGLAKKVALKLQALGYPVVKTGNADKQTYAKTEILVKKNLLSRIDSVIADLKDNIKIASIAGELKEGTASARIIIGKDVVE